MMSHRPVAVSGLLVLLVVLSGFTASAVALAPGAAAASSSPPVTGSITGPSVVAEDSASELHITGSGGPAVAQNGTFLGTITYYAQAVGPNLTGIDISPSTLNITNNQSSVATLSTGNATETISIDVMISSTYQGENQSTNISFSVTIVEPYVVSATIVNPSNFTVAAFSVYVTLDGNVIGQVNVSSLLAGGSFKVTYKYATLGLSTGDHTFAISLAQEHGLVTFANGETAYTETVYVTGPAPNYTLWYVAGTVAFFGAIFIFVSRVAARRRGTTRR